MKNKKGIFPLKNPIQNYDWGSKEFIPDLLGMPPSDIPQAELWMGAHPKAPSQVKIDGRWISLLELCKTEGDFILKNTKIFPFLMKVIAIERPLSIQAHPDKEYANKGFQKENGLKIPLDSPIRNYRDPNPKPEMLCALTDFTALKGFRAQKEILQLLDQISIPSLGKEMELLKSKEKNMKRFFQGIMTKRLNPEIRKKTINDVISGIQKGNLSGDISGIVMRLYRFFPDDIGILSPFFLNIIGLKPHEAIYIAPGEPHAYLDGAGIELMTNSDNVLRGGLTSKHIDIEELIKILNFKPSKTKKLAPHKKTDNYIQYKAPGHSLSLLIITIENEKIIFNKENSGPQIIICTDGETEIGTETHPTAYNLKRGNSVIIASKVSRYYLNGKAVLFCGMAE